MPITSRFFGIVVCMDWRDPMPAHFRAKYQDQEIPVDVATGEIIGQMGRTATAPIQEWRELHLTALLQDWEPARQKKELRRIEPSRGFCGPRGAGPLGWMHCVPGTGVTGRGGAAVPLGAPLGHSYSLRTAQIITNGSIGLALRYWCFSLGSTRAKSPAFSGWALPSPSTSSPTPEMM